MSTAEWTVLGLLLAVSGILLLFRHGLPKREQHHALSSWLGLILLVAGTLCQIWANLRWVG
jgi:drug/metabolite transporter (DMT)-like permease